MKIIRNRYIPFKGFRAMFFFGILFVRNDLESELKYWDMNHEAIHAKQCKEMLGVFFYLWYIAEYVVRLFQYGFDTRKAYRNISFEREAYENQADMLYTDDRKIWAWVKYINR